jgi:hypothetical protein
MDYNKNTIEKVSIRTICSRLLPGIVYVKPPDLFKFKFILIIVNFGLDFTYGQPLHKKGNFGVEFILPATGGQIGGQGHVQFGVPVPQVVQQG